MERPEALPCLRQCLRQSHPIGHIHREIKRLTARRAKRGKEALSLAAQRGPAQQQKLSLPLLRQMEGDLAPDPAEPARHDVGATAPEGGSLAPARIEPEGWSQPSPIGRATHVSGRPRIPISALRRHVGELHGSRVEERLVRRLDRKLENAERERRRLEREAPGETRQHRLCRHSATVTPHDTEDIGGRLGAGHERSLQQRHLP